MNFKGYKLSSKKVLEIKKKKKNIKKLGLVMQLPEINFKKW